MSSLTLDKGSIFDRPNSVRRPFSAKRLLVSKSVTQGASSTGLVTQRYSDWLEDC